MLLPVLVLLAGALAVGVVPAVARGVSSAVVQFLDGPGYVDQALRGSAARAAAALPEAAWTTTGVLLGLASALLAAGLAAVALWAPRLPALLSRAGRRLEPAVDGLRRIHSGHVGDYVAWLFLGITALAVLVGAPLL